MIKSGLEANKMRFILKTSFRCKYNNTVLGMLHVIPFIKLLFSYIINIDNTLHNTTHKLILIRTILLKFWLLGSYSDIFITCELYRSGHNAY